MIDFTEAVFGFWIGVSALTIVLMAFAIQKLQKKIAGLEEEMQNE